MDTHEYSGDPGKDRDTDNAIDKYDLLDEGVGPPHDIHPAGWHKLAWVVLPISFAIPLFLLFIMAAVWFLLHDDGVWGSVNESTLAVTGTADVITSTPTLAVTPVWPSDVYFAAHTVPAIIRHDLARGGDQHGYQFYGAAGETWHLTVEPWGDSTIDPALTLYGPSGEQLGYDDRAVGEVSADLWVTLPAAGDYRVMIEAANYTTGMYGLTLFEQ